MLVLSGVLLSYTQQELVDLAVDIARDFIEIEDIIAWIKSRIN